jgi:agmatinase
MDTILKIPFELGLVERERRGTARAPDAIEREYASLLNAPKARFISIKIENNFETDFSRIQRLAEKQKKIITIGGDHSISFPLIKAFSKQHKNPALIYLDAHLDCEDDFIPPTHESILRAVIKQKLIPAENILVIGVRNWTKIEQAFVGKNKLNVIFGCDLEKSITAVKNFCKAHKNIYLSLDIDVIDPAFAPGTGWPEPAGFSSKEILSLLKSVSNIRAFDVMEVSPKSDLNNSTSRLATRILLHLLS